MYGKRGIMKSNFLKSSAILFIGDLLTKILGFIYLAPLEAINPGIGAVQGYLMMPYSFFITFSVMGITNAMMYKLGPVRDDKDAYKRNFLDGVYYVCLTSLVITTLLVIFAKPMMVQAAGQVEYLDQLVSSLRILAISILFFAVNTLLRSLLMSKSHLKIISITYISEQLAKIIILLGGCYYLLTIKGAPLGASAYVTGWSVTLSVASTTLILIIYCLKHNLFDFLKAAKYVWKFASFKAIFMLGGVYFVNSIFISGFNQIDLAIFNNSLERAGYSLTQIQDYTSIYFTWSWKLIMVVITLGSVFITVMIKQMTQVDTIGQKVAEMKTVLDFVLLYTLLATVFFLTAGGDFYQFFYSESQVGVLIMMAQALLIVPFMLRMILSIFSITVGQRRIVLLSTAVIFAVKIIANPILFHYFEVYGYILASFLAAIASIVFMLVLDAKIYQFTKQEYLHKLSVIARMFVVYLISQLAMVAIHQLELSYFTNFMLGSIVILAVFGLINYKYIRGFIKMT